MSLVYMQEPQLLHRPTKKAQLFYLIELTIFLMCLIQKWHWFFPITEKYPCLKP